MKTRIESYPVYILALLLALFTQTAHAGGTVSASQLRYNSYFVPINTSILVKLRKRERIGTGSRDKIASYYYSKEGHQLVIRGESLGTTNIIILDHRNRVSRTLNIEVGFNLASLKRTLYKLLPGENIKLSSTHNSIVMSGEVSNASNMDAAVKLAQGYIANTKSSQQGQKGGVINMMKVGGGQQVMLAVKIAEVSRTIARQLALNSGASKTNTGTDDDFFWNILAAGAGLFTGSYVAGDVLFNWTLDFSRDTGLATILAEPNLTTMSGQKASFLSGGEFPYLEDCSQNDCSVGFKQFGVGLEFVPVVLDSNRINLNTHVSVSALTNSAAEVTGVSTQEPSLSLREAQTTVELADGQTMSIAGLLSSEFSNDQSHVPGVADIPLVGALFRNRSALKEQKELIILVTPHLAKPIPQDQIRLPTEAFVEPDDVDFYLLGRMESRKVRTLPNQDDNGGMSGQFGHQINE